MSFDLSELKMPKISISMGITTAYVLYVGGYIITQILTPVVSSAGFYIENLLVFIPNILSSGLIAAVIGGITVPAIFALKKINITIDHLVWQAIIYGDHGRVDCPGFAVALKMDQCGNFVFFTANNTDYKK